MSNLTQFLISDRSTFPLVKKFYQQHYPAGKPNKKEIIWLLRNKYEVLSCARLKNLNTYCLLTAVVTHQAYRRQGYGALLLTEIKQQLKQGTYYCYTDKTLEAFYNAVGFENIHNSLLPEEARKKYLSYHQKNHLLIPMRLII